MSLLSFYTKFEFHIPDRRPLSVVLLPKCPLSQPPQDPLSTNFGFLPVLTWPLAFCPRPSSLDLFPMILFFHLCCGIGARTKDQARELKQCPGWYGPGLRATLLASQAVLTITEDLTPITVPRETQVKSEGESPSFV